MNDRDAFLTGEPDMVLKPFLRVRLLLIAMLALVAKMSEKYAGTPLAKYFVSNPENVPTTVNAVRRRQP